MAGLGCVAFSVHVLGPVLGVSGLGCVAFCVHVLGPVSSPLGVSDLSLRNPAGEGFLLGLSPDLGGVWLF